MNQARRDMIKAADKNLREECLPIDFFAERTLEIAQNRSMPGFRTFIEIMLAFGCSSESHEHAQAGEAGRRASCFGLANANRSSQVTAPADFHFAKDLEFDSELLIRKCLGLYGFQASDRLSQP
jgi:hypothetical protein